MTPVDDGLVFGFGDSSLSLYSDAPEAVSWAAATLPPFMPLVSSSASLHVAARFYDDGPGVGGHGWGEAQPLFLGRSAVGRSGDGWRELIDTAAQTRYRIEADRVTSWYGRPSRFLLHEPARLVREMLVGQARRAGWCRLHAAAVAVDGRVALILGGAGAGKSSTVAQLVAAGASFVANDRLLATGDIGTSVRVVGLPVAVRWSEAQLRMFAAGRDWIDHYDERSLLRRKDDRAAHLKFELTVGEVAALVGSPAVSEGGLAAIVVADRRAGRDGTVLGALTASESLAKLRECRLDNDPAFPAFYELEPPDEDRSEQAFDRLCAGIGGLPSFHFRSSFDDTSAVGELMAEIALSSPHQQAKD